MKSLNQNTNNNNNVAINYDTRTISSFLHMQNIWALFEYLFYVNQLYQ